MYIRMYLWRCKHVHIYIYVYIYTYIHVYTYVYIYTYMYRHHSDNRSTPIDQQGLTHPKVGDKMIDQKGLDVEETPPGLKTQG